MSRTVEDGRLHSIVGRLVASGAGIVLSVAVRAAANLVDKPLHDEVIAALENRRHNGYLRLLQHGSSISSVGRSDDKEPHLVLNHPYQRYKLKVLIDLPILVEDAAQPGMQDEVIDGRDLHLMRGRILLGRSHGGQRLGRHC